MIDTLILTRSSKIRDHPRSEIIRHIRYDTIIILLFIADQPCKYFPRIHDDDDDDDDSDDGDDDDEADHKI